MIKQMIKQHQQGARSAKYYHEIIGKSGHGKGAPSDKTVENSRRVSIY